MAAGEGVLGLLIPLPFWGGVRVGVGQRVLYLSTDALPLSLTLSPEGERELGGAGDVAVAAIRGGRAGGEIVAFAG